MVMSDPVELVRRAGVIGAGGAGFPTHVKLSSRTDTVIGNGSECEPLLRVDQTIMRLHASKVARGLDIARSIVGAEDARVAIKSKHGEAIERMASAGRPLGIGVFELDDFYPAGDEVSLIFEVTGRVVPEGGLPGHVGCLVQNVVTLRGIAEAVDDEKPVTTRPISVTGDLPTPSVLEVPIGTPARIAIEAVGGDLEGRAVLDGGPMMGRFIDPDKAVVTKKTSGFILLPSDHDYLVRKRITPDREQSISHAACEQCRLCTDYCPRYLLGHRCHPHAAMRANRGGRPRSEDVLTSFLCCECGLCTLWACPIPIYPREIMVQMKAALRDSGVPNPFGAAPSAERFIRGRKVPVKRLIERLGLSDWDREAEWREGILNTGIVRVPLGAHAGTPARPIVSEGDPVKVGEVVGLPPEGAVGAVIHASINGRITFVSGDFIEITGGL